MPKTVKTVCARADLGFYCWKAVQAYEKRNCQFIVVARKTARLMDQLKAADWEPSPRTDADGQCEFLCQPDQFEQYQLFDTPSRKPTTTPVWRHTRRTVGS